MRGFLKPKNIIVWFGVLIKVKPTHTQNKQWWPKFPAEWLQHIGSYYEIKVWIMQDFGN